VTARRAAIVFLLLGVALVPWSILLSIKLPSRKVADHFDVAWVGFDLMLATMMFATAYALLHRWGSARSLSAASGALLVADAWFDVVTASTSNERWFAIALAVLIELPLATLCFILARPEDPDRIER
jgi:hypothetical protein